MLKIQTPNGYLKLGPKTEIPLTITNPLFNERGSYSLPFSIPLKPNKTTLGFPGSHHNKNIINQFVDCIIEHGLFKEKGTLKIIEITGDEIELSLTTREGAFWEWAKKNKLRDIRTSPDRYFDIKNTFSSYFDHIWPEVDMAFFPVAIEKNTEFLLDEDIDYYDALYYGGNERLLKNFYVLNNPQYLMRVNQQVIRSGITGFLYLNEILSWIINTYGVRFGVNDLSNPEMNRCVVLNSATNPFRNNQTHLSELLPSVTILEFIDAIEKTFACMFFYNSANKSLDIRYLKNIYTINNCKEIIGKIKKFKPYRSGLQIITSAEVINSDNTIVNDSLSEEYIRSTINFYEEQTPVRENDKVYLSLSSADYVNYPDRFVFNIPTQCYFILKWEKDENENKWLYRAKSILSRYYDYSPPTNLDVKEYFPKMSFTPMVKTEFVQYFMHTEDYAGRFNYSMLLPHFNISKQEYESELLDNYVYKHDIETPVSFAFYRGKHRVNFPTTFERIIPGVKVPINEQVEFHDSTFWDIPWGSTDVYSYEGEKLSGEIVDQPNLVSADLALRWVGEYGLLQHFKEVEQCYKKGLKQGEINTTDIQILLKNRIYEIYRIDDANLFVDKIELTLKPHQLVVDSIEVRLMKPYD